MTVFLLLLHDKPVSQSALNKHSPPAPPLAYQVKTMVE
jgi:hypothetical protein